MEGFQSSLAQLSRPLRGLSGRGCDPGKAWEGCSLLWQGLQAVPSLEDSREPSLDLSEGRTSLRSDWARVRGGAGSFMDQSLPTRPCAHCVMLGKPLPLSGLPFLVCKISGGGGGGAG